MSWGRKPEPGGVTVSRRKNASSPVEVTFSRVPLATQSEDGKKRVFEHSAFAVFEHRDGRIWTSRTLPILKANPLYNEHYRLLTRITTAGVEPVRLLSTRLQSAKTSISCFANMPIDRYRIITADATGTLDNPVTGREVKVQLTDETRNETQVRWGRVEGAMVVLYPTQGEINEVLDTTIDPETEVLERYIQEHGLADLSDDGEWRGRTAERLRVVQLNTTQRVSRRQFGAVVAALDQLCDADGRELRAIQL